MQPHKEGGSKIRADRSKHTAILAATVALAAGAIWAVAAIKGPWMCGRRAVSTPYPDAGTKQFLDDILPVFGFRWTEAGNTFIVCNGEFCGQYLVTDSGDIYGTKRDKQQNGTVPGHGGGGKGGGTVIVKPPIVDRPG